MNHTFGIWATPTSLKRLFPRQAPSALQSLIKRCLICLLEGNITVEFVSLIPPKGLPQELSNLSTLPFLKSPIMTQFMTFTGLLQRPIQSLWVPQLMDEFCGGTLETFQTL
jgi:hypothetical protein